MNFIIRALLFASLLVVSFSSFADCTLAAPCADSASAYAACESLISGFNPPGSCTLAVGNPSAGILNAWQANVDDGSKYAVFAFYGNITCSPNVKRFGVWINTPGQDSGDDCNNGCAETAFIDPTAPSGQSFGYETTGATCKSGPDASPGNPPPQSTTCHPDGTCTYCANNGAGPCVTSKPASGSPPPITGPASGASSPPPPGLGSGSGSNPPSSSSSGGSGSGSSGGSGGSGSGGSGGGAGTGSGGTSPTGNGGPQPSNNGDWDKGPAHSTSSNCTAGDACNAGQASGVVGMLYQSSGDSIGKEYSNFKAQVSNSPIVSSIGGFFAFTPSGTCPTWHIPGNKYWGEAGFDFSFFCNAAFLAILQAAGLIVLAVGAFSAFRIALY